MNAFRPGDLILEKISSRRIELTVLLCVRHSFDPCDEQLSVDGIRCPLDGRRRNVLLTCRFAVFCSQDEALCRV